MFPVSVVCEPELLGTGISAGASNRPFGTDELLDLGVDRAGLLIPEELDEGTGTESGLNSNGGREPADSGVASPDCTSGSGVVVP